MAKFELNEIKGVIPALITCFDENENFDERRMRVFVRHLLTYDIGGLYVAGSTGEAFLMSNDEKLRVIETVIDEVQGKIPVIVHVGAIGTKLSIELAGHAAKMGADAISSVPPFYWKFTDDDIYKYYREISEAVSLPMIVYNISLAGLVDFELIKRLAGIDGVKGIKYTATTHYEIAQIKNEVGTDFQVFSGCDEMALSGLAFHADGIIGSFYNLIPEVFIEIYNAVQRNDFKTAIMKQDIANKIILQATKYDYYSLMKRMISWTGIDAGYCRRPFTDYTEKTESKIREEFKRIKQNNDVSGIRFMRYI